MTAAATALSASRIDQFMRFGKALDRVNKGIGKEDFETRLQDLFGIVTEINQANDDFIRKHRYLGMTPKAWLRCGFGVTCLAGLATAANFASSISTNYYNNQLDCDYPEEVIGTNTSAASLLFVLWIAQSIFSGLNGKRESEESDLKEKMQGVQQLQQFFLAYNAFMNPANLESTPDQRKRLDTCITNLNGLPEDQIPKEAKDRWVQVLIGALPEENTIRQRLSRQQEIAEKLDAHERKLKELEESLESKTPKASDDEPPREEKTSRKKGKLKEKKRKKSEEAITALENPPELTKKSSSGELATDTFLDETIADSSSETRPKQAIKPVNQQEELRAEFRRNLSDLSEHINYPLSGFWFKKTRFDDSGKIILAK